MDSGHTMYQTSGEKFHFQKLTLCSNNTAVHNTDVDDVKNVWSYTSTPSIRPHNVVFNYALDIS